MGTRASCAYSQAARAKWGRVPAKLHRGAWEWGKCSAGVRRSLRWGAGRAAPRRRSAWNAAHCAVFMPPATARSPQRRSGDRRRVRLAPLRRTAGGSGACLPCAPVCECSHYTPEQSDAPHCGAGHYKGRQSEATVAFAKSDVCRNRTGDPWLSSLMLP